MIIDTYELDKNQTAIAQSNANFLLVVAGAGSGKTLTILGKIKYLIDNNILNERQILCISFTKASSVELKNKIRKNLHLDMEVYTFHKLAINFLTENNIDVKICDTDLLENIIHKYIYIDVLEQPKQMKYILINFKQIYINKKQYQNFINKNPDQVKIFIRNILTFIHLFKCGGYKYNYLNKIIKANKFSPNKYFYLVIINIIYIYEKYLEENNENDFDDLIIKATQIIHDKHIKSNYKYIIIDEYQDTSHIRFKLIKEIINNSNSKLMVVGDDFQSIYKFTGCDIDLFTNFRNYFNDGQIMYITNTYRNSQELISIAGDFVMKNKKQIKKKLKSNKHLNKPIILQYYHNIISETEKIINEIYAKYNNEILILGRNNNDVYTIIDNITFKLKDNNIIYLKNKDINIKYLTVHKSKGLESDNVIIINMTNNLLGFPSNIKNDKKLKYVIKEEKYKYAEERRLFYVALTRTKNYVYLLVPYQKKSPFIKELEKNSNVEKRKN